MPSEGGGSGEDRSALDADALLASLAAWAGEARLGEAAAARGRERWMRRQAAESATWVGVLLDLAEQGGSAVVALGARRVAGRIVGLGHDMCVVADRGGSATVVALAHVTAVHVAHDLSGGAGGGGLAGGAGRAGGGGGGLVGGGGPARPATEPAGDRDPALDLSLASLLTWLGAERSPVRIGLAGGEAVAGELVAVGTDVLTVRTPDRRAVVHVPLRAVETCTPTR